MSDLLTVIAAIEWIVVGVLVYRRLRQWNQRLQTLFDDMRKDISYED